MIYSRWQKKIVEKALSSRRVLLLNGPRQCGKTTLAKQLAGTDVLYRTLDDVAIREFAQNDPREFVKNIGKMQIIDEIQRAPNLLPAIKLVVDEDTRPGQYLLTGSSNIQALPSTQESLAGRIRKIRLRPLSQGEKVEAEPSFIDKAFSKNFSSHKNIYNRNTILKIALRGGFPEVMHFDDNECQQWHRDYMTALLERVLLDIARITQHHAMSELVHTLAAWSSKFMDITAMSSNFSIRRQTIETYINALEALFLVERVHPWTRTDYERVGKQSKYYMTDSGLMSSILRWNMEQIEFDADRSGKLIETFIFNELAAQVDVHDDQYELFHYRDREKREIDFLIERSDQALLGIEVKAKSTISKADFKHLKWFQENIAKNKPFVGIVLYSGEFAGSMGDNLWAVPFGQLWENNHAS